MRTCADFSGAAGWDWPRAFLLWIYHEMGPQFTVVGLLAALYGLWRRRLLTLFLAAVLLGLAAIALNLRGWVLPMSILAYPDRAVYFLILPVGVLMAAALEEARARWSGRRGYRAGAVAVAVLVAGLAGAKGYSRYLAVYRGSVVVTSGDFEAMEWIRRHTGPGELFLNLEGDSGMWIPAFADRPITDPHGPPIYFSQPVPASPPGYLYLGKGAGRRDPEEILGGRGIGARVEMVFEREATAIYRLR